MRRFINYLDALFIGMLLGLIFVTVMHAAHCIVGERFMLTGSPSHMKAMGAPIVKPFF